MTRDRNRRRLERVEAKKASEVSLDIGGRILAARKGPQRPLRTRELLEATALMPGLPGLMARGDLRLCRIGQSNDPIDPAVELPQQMAEFFEDPLGFVLWSFDWGNDPATRVVRLPALWSDIYDAEFGPDRWACEVLEELSGQVRANPFDGATPVPPLQIAISSGHGIGKSFLTAMLALWIMSTRPNAKGIVTASTQAQLASKTWSTIATWTKRCATADWWDLGIGRGSMKLSNRERPEAWQMSAQTAADGREESFAGQHASDSSSFYLVDESSGVPDKIHEVMQGGLTDGQPFLFAAGNPTRNTGWFHGAFHGQRHRWTTWTIDSRSVQITNKPQLQRWIEDYGIESDFCKVRIRGAFPSASSLQFIGQDIVDAAVARETPSARGEVMVVSADIARFGGDSTVIFTRQGRDARSIPAIKLQGADTMAVASRIAEHVNMLRSFGHRVLIAVDGGGVGGGVVDRLRSLHFDVVEVQFGSRALDPRRYAQRRSELWGLMKEWLKVGAIPKDDELIQDLVSPEYGFNLAEAIQLEKKSDMKARGLASPDIADALAISFAVNPAIPMADDATYAANDERDRERVLAYDPLEHLA